jgi:hypothetical protein
MARSAIPIIAAINTRGEVPCFGAALGFAGADFAGAGVVETFTRDALLAPPSGTGGITIFFAAVFFLAGAFLATFLAADFFFAGAFLAAAFFLAGAFLATLLAAAFFLAGAFLATFLVIFLAAVFFAGAFLTTLFLATFLVAAFFLTATVKLLQD